LNYTRTARGLRFGKIGSLATYRKDDPPPLCTRTLWQGMSRDFLCPLTILKIESAAGRGFGREGEAGPCGALICAQGALE